MKHPEFPTLKTYSGIPDNKSGNYPSMSGHQYVIPDISRYPQKAFPIHPYLCPEPETFVYGARDLEPHEPVMELVILRLIP